MDGIKIENLFKEKSIQIKFKNKNLDDFPRHFPAFFISTL